jgi:hypothetical protein
MKFLRLLWSMEKQSSRLSSVWGRQKNLQTAPQNSLALITPNRKKGTVYISTLAALVIAAAAFSVYAVTQSGKVPEGAIGQADATTNIQIEGAFAFDISQILLAIGFAATAIALLLIIRTIHKNRR